MSPAAPTRRPARSAPSGGKRPVRSAPSGAKRPAATTASKPASRRLPLALIIGGALAIGLVVVIVLTMGSGESSQPLEVGTPTLTGNALPAYDPNQADAALGQPIPEVAGANFSGAPVSIARDGRPKMLIFFAHWCSVCQREVPLIAQWLPTAALPANLDIISVSTGVNRNYDNYPPSLWLTRESWTVPVILDDGPTSVATAFGLSAYPYFVFVNADGTVAYRITGALPITEIEQRIAQVTGGSQ